MDWVSSYKEKLSRFRLKELKDVLMQLGLSKQGKKQDLVDRIVASLSIEVSELHGLAKKNIIEKGKVAGIIDDAYRKLQGVEATSSSMNEESFSEIDNLKPKEEVVDHFYSDKEIRCPCGSSLPTEHLIQCADPQCGVFQHMSCVIIPEEMAEGIPSVPCRHYCEICRIKRADPFQVTVTHLLSPVKLITSNIPYDGSNPVQNVEKAFQLRGKDRHSLHHVEYNVQAWCILLNDKVQFRMQWPLFADLKVNGVPVRTVNRPGSQFLGANGRDDGPMIAFYMVDGWNQISLSGCDARSFCLGVRIVKERTVQQILELILEEQNSEPLEDALARVQRCLGGGMTMATEDSDSDLEVISDFVTVNLRCPMGGVRIKTAGRFRACAHMGCFDLETYVQLNQRSKKWQCPVCLKNYSLEDITVDPYFNRITKMVQDCEEDVTEIDVQFDGCWRVKNGHWFKNLDQWHFPDGSLCDSTKGIISNSEASREFNGESIVGCINHKQVSKLGDIQTSFRNPQGEHFESYNEDVITMSSSSCDSRGDGDRSVNQNSTIGNFDISVHSGHAIHSVSSNFDAIANPIVKKTSVSLGDLDIIVLSDSDDENASLFCPESIPIPKAVNDVKHSAPASGISNSFAENLARDTGLSSSLGIFNCNDNDFQMCHQTFASGTRADSVFHHLGTGKDLDAVVDTEYSPVTTSPPIYGNVLTSKRNVDTGRQIVDSSVCHSNTQINGSLVSNLQACDFNPPQSSLRTQSPGMSLHSEMVHHPQISYGMRGESLTPFGLRNNSDDDNSAAGAHGKASTSGGQDFANRFASNEALSSPVSNKEVRSETTAYGERSNGPFTFPRRPRSARRQYLP